MLTRHISDIMKWASNKNFSKFPDVPFSVFLKIYILYKYLSTEKFQKQQEMSSKDHLWGFDSGVGTLFCSLGNIDSRPEWKKNMLNKAVTSCA